MRELRLCVCPCFSNNDQHVLFVLLGWFLRWQLRGHTVALLLGITSRICSEQNAAVMCISHLAFMWRIRIVSLTQQQLGRNPVFFSLERSDFHMINNLSIAIHTFVKYMLASLSVDERLLSRYVNLSIYFIGLPLKVKTAPSRFKQCILLAITWKLMFTAGCSRLSSRIWFGLVHLREALDVLSAYVIIFAGYYLLLAFFNVKPFSFY